MKVLPGPKRLALVALVCALGRAVPSLAAQGLPLLDALPAPQERDPVAASLAFDVSEISPGSASTATLSLEHEPGWHTYGPDPGEAGLSTTIEWNLPQGLSAGPIRWPAAKEFDDRGVKSRGFDGTALLRVEIQADKSIRPGTMVSIGAKASWLACKESCIPGEASFEYSIPAGKAKPFSSGAFRLILSILGAFLGGIILNLMPCVLPVLSLKLHGLILQASEPRKAALRNGLAYALGVLLSFWIIAGILVALKAGGRAIGWGFQFQDPRFVSLMAAFFMAFALNMLGVFEIGAGAASLAGRPIRAEGLLRAFASGVLATAAATPCTAPFMGAAIGYALSASPIATLLVFSALGLGLASPIVILSAFPSLASRLPKAGRWTETLRQALGFVLLGTIVWLLSVLGSLAGSRALVAAVAALLGTSLAAWVWGRWGGYDSTRGVRTIARAFAIIVFALSIALVLFPSSTAGSRKAEFEAALGTREGASENRLPWQAFDPALLARLRSEGKPVFIDFTADWCLSCKANEIAVLDRPAVIEEFAKRGVIPLKADWTRSDPAITAALASYGRASVPLYVFYLPGRESPLILPEILTTAIVMKALSQTTQNVGGADAE